MISALIFDFDGLILDTEKSEFVSWQEMYAEHQVQLLLEEWAVCIGAGADTFDPYTHLETLLRRPIAREEIRQRRLQRRMAMLAEELLLPGVEDYLRTARHLRLKLGVASSSSRAWVEGHLERLGILHYFDVIRCRDDVQHAKPDPRTLSIGAGRPGSTSRAGYRFRGFSQWCAGCATRRYLLCCHSQRHYQPASARSCRLAPDLNGRNASGGFDCTG